MAANRGSVPCDMDPQEEEVQPQVSLADNQSSVMYRTCGDPHGYKQANRPDPVGEPNEKRPATGLWPLVVTNPQGVLEATREVKEACARSAKMIHDHVLREEGEHPSSEAHERAKMEPPPGKEEGDIESQVRLLLHQPPPDNEEGKRRAGEAEVGKAADRGLKPRCVLNHQVRQANTSEIISEMEETALMVRERIREEDPHGHKRRAKYDEPIPCSQDPDDPLVQEWVAAQVRTTISQPLPAHYNSKLIPGRDSNGLTTWHTITEMPEKGYQVRTLPHQPPPDENEDRPTAGVPRPDVGTQGPTTPPKNKVTKPPKIQGGQTGKNNIQNFFVETAKDIRGAILSGEAFELHSSGRPRGVKEKGFMVRVMRVLDTMQGIGPECAAERRGETEEKRGSLMRVLEELVGVEDEEAGR
jgi:hypothetical protein